MEAIYDDIKNPHDNDVVGGRGKGFINHPGNIDYRRLVVFECDRYIAGSNEEKKRIVSQIINKVKSKNPPGRFLNRDKKTDPWTCMDVDKILRKVSHSLREDRPQLEHQLLVRNNNDISTTPPSCSVLMNTDRSKPPLCTETGRIIPLLTTGSTLSSAFSSFCGIIDRHHNASDLHNTTMIVPPQQPHMPPSPPISTPIYKECNIDTNSFEVKDLAELLMATSVDDLKAGIKVEEEKMAEVKRIEIELKKLQKVYEERKSVLNPSYLVCMKAITKEKQSTRTISNNSGENIESRRDIYQEIKDESMKSLSEGSIETMHLDCTVDSLMNLDYIGSWTSFRIPKEDCNDNQETKDESMKSLSEGSIETMHLDHTIDSLMNSESIGFWKTFKIPEEDCNDN